MRIFTNDKTKTLRGLLSVQWNIANKWWTQAQTNSGYRTLRSSPSLICCNCTWSAKEEKEPRWAKQLRRLFFLWLTIDQTAWAEKRLDFGLPPGPPPPVVSYCGKQCVQSRSWHRLHLSLSPSGPQSSFRISVAFSGHTNWVVRFSGDLVSCAPVTDDRIWPHGNSRCKDAFGTCCDAGRLVVSRRQFAKPVGNHSAAAPADSPQAPSRCPLAFLET